MHCCNIPLCVIGCKIQSIFGLHELLVLILCRFACHRVYVKKILTKNIGNRTNPSNIMYAALIQPPYIYELKNNTQTSS